jgi:hypothetical protein
MGNGRAPVGKSSQALEWQGIVKNKNKQTCASNIMAASGITGGGIAVGCLL